MTSLGELEVMPLLVAKLFRKKVVMVQGGTYKKTFEAIYSKRWLGLGKIIPGIAGLLARVTHGLADGIVVDTQDEAKFFGLSRYKGKILVCGIAYMDTDVFQVTRNLEDRRKVVGYAGRFSPEKGVINLVKAIPLMLEEQPDMEFLMCGDGPLFAEVKKEIEVGKTTKKVTLTGWVPLERIPEYLNQMQLLVIPSYLEGLPKILMEAMACGTPVLATAVGGIPHLIRKEETGFILKSNSPEHIAEGVIMTLHYPKLHDIAETAHRLIESRYTYEFVVKSWENALQQLMKRGNEL
jgi:glycosyltransferase involved in cell wall biosynthesis